MSPKATFSYERLHPNRQKLVPFQAGANASLVVVNRMIPSHSDSEPPARLGTALGRERLCGTTDPQRPGCAPGLLHMA